MEENKEELLQELRKLKNEKMAIIQKIQDIDNELNLIQQTNEKDKEGR